MDGVHPKVTLGVMSGRAEVLAVAAVLARFAACSRHCWRRGRGPVAVVWVAVYDQESFESSAFPDLNAQFEGKSSEEVERWLCFRAARPSLIEWFRHAGR